MAKLDLAELKVEDIDFQDSGYEEDLAYLERYLKRRVSLKKRLKTLLVRGLDFCDARLSALRGKVEKKSARSEDSVLTKYDDIAGSYVDSLSGGGVPMFVKNGTQRGLVNSIELNTYKTAYISSVINHFGGCSSILEVGAGEFTSLYPVVSGLHKRPDVVAGLDLSWSRVQQGIAYCKSQSFDADHYICGNAARLPFLDKSIDYLYTVHCLEQMPSVLESALREFDRVTRKKIILVEPSFEHGEPLQQKWIEMKGYVKGVRALAETMGMLSLLDCALPVREFHLNSGILVLEPTKGTQQNAPKLVCPVDRSELKEIDGVLHSEKSGLSYPVIGRIPCLDVKHGILTGKLLKR